MVLVDGVPVCVFYSVFEQSRVLFRGFLLSIFFRVFFLFHVLQDGFDELSHGILLNNTCWSRLFFQIVYRIQGFHMLFAPNLCDDVRYILQLFLDFLTPMRACTRLSAPYFYKSNRDVDKWVRKNDFWRFALQITCRILDFDRQLGSRQKMPLPLHESVGMPRMEVVDWSASKVLGRQLPTNSFFEAANAEKAICHTGSFPNTVSNHVVLPATLMPAASLASARCSVDLAILADVDHFITRLYTRGSIASRVVLINILRVVVSYLRPLRASSTTRRTTSLVVRPSALASSWSQSNWGSLKVTDCLAMWRSVAPLYAVVN
jgi:hypothetical protein